MNYAATMDTTAAPFRPVLTPPVIGTGRPTARQFRVPAGLIVLAVVLALPILCAAGIASYFRLSSATRALRSSVMESVPGRWDKKFAINVGGFTLSAVRFGSQWFNLPPEPRAALNALHGAEVGVYRRQATRRPIDYPALFAAADKAMKQRGWERVVGVAKGQEFVAVYAPLKLRSVRNVACCVVVLNHDELVVVSGRGNLQPLLELASERLEGNNPLAKLSHQLSGI